MKTISMENILKRRETIYSGLSAENYSRMTKRSIFYRMHLRKISRDINRYPLKNAKMVLDVGAGPGTLTGRLSSSRGPGCTFIGTDINPEMIEVMKLASLKQGKSMRFVIHENRFLPFKEASFDMVISVNSLHHFKFPSVMFKEMARVTKTGGYILVFDFNPFDIRLRFFYYLYSFWNKFFNKPHLNGFIESVRSAYNKKEIGVLLQEAGIKESSVYTKDIFNAVAIRVK
ncbi:MAG: class I SAM-dependent methyltransferase [Candidatus Omnitrophica bacterium]|nr:class I SAM-dependent methyltransferase [Candidatus Omnitrophota bacterium]